MKLIFSFLFTYTSTALSGQINIYYETKQNKAFAEYAQNYFINNYHIPRKLIHIREASLCQSFDKRFLELCILKDGELEVLNKNKTLSKINSLKVFYF